MVKYIMFSKLALLYNVSGIRWTIGYSRISSIPSEDDNCCPYSKFWSNVMVNK